MARKPVSQLRGGIAPRQRIWTAIRAHGVGQHWTADDILSAARLSGDLAGSLDPATLRTYLQCLCAAGIVREYSTERIKGAAVRKTYALLRDEGVEAPRLRRDGSRVTQGLAQEQMWRTLRMLAGDINARELAAHASSSQAPVMTSSANKYLRMLHTAGYLLCTRAGHAPRNGHAATLARYRLRPEMNTGPQPPMLCRARVVYDPNLCEVVWAPTVTEEDAIHEQ